MDSTTTENITRNRLIGSALILLAAIGFSSKSILIKLAYADSPEVDAITLMALRMVMSLPFFLAVALWRTENPAAKHTVKDWAALTVLGMMGYYLASLLDFRGLVYIPAGLERLILFLYPTIVVLLTALWYRRPISQTKRRALLLSYAGMALVFLESSTGGNLHKIVLGSTLVFGSSLVFAIFLTGSGHFIPRFGARRFTAWSMSVACIATLTHFATTHPLEQLLVSTKVFLLGAMLALFSTVLPAFLMNTGIQRVGAANAAIVSAAGPVATLAMAFAILGETLSLTQVIGTVMILGGVLLVSLSKEKI